MPIQDAHNFIHYGLGKGPITNDQRHKPNDIIGCTRLTPLFFLGYPKNPRNNTWG